MHQNSLIRTLVFVVCLNFGLIFAEHASAQDRAAQQADVTELIRVIGDIQDPFRRPPLPPVAQEKKQDDKKKDDDKKKAEDDTPVVKRKEIKPANPREVRFHLWDGNIFTGNLSGDGITVETEFGNLVIPVEKLYGFRPGLNSYPQLSGKLKSLVEKLGDKDFNTRELSHKEIVRLGPQFLMEVYQFEDGGNAERKRHLKEIREELEELAEDIENDDELDEQNGVAMIRGDAVQTRDFTVVGQIKEKTFTVKTKHGELNVKLADIKYMDRAMTGGGEVRKTIKVLGSNMLAKSMKSTGIRVEKGDTITIRASGSITMTPWGSNRASDPEGSTRYSKYENFNGGSLVIQIGDAKALFAGKKKTIKANASGTLKMGVAIPRDYMNYAFPGEYKVVTRVIHGGSR